MASIQGTGMRFVKKLLAVGVLLAGCTLQAHAQRLSPDATAQLVNAVVKPVLQRNHVFGAAVLVYNQGQPQAFYFGTATHNRYNHVNSATVFEIGSVTKVFTSVLLANESNLGQVDLSDPVIMYLKNAPVSNRSFDQLTVASLATHVSGLGQMPANTVRNRYDVLQNLRRWHSPYRPNSWWKYSNIGFGILGYVLEDVTHQSYLAMLKHQITTPLHMTDTGLVGSTCFSCAQGYSWNGGAVNTTKTLLVIPAAGSIRASGRDMLKFLAAALQLPGTPPALANAFRLTQMPFFQTQYGSQGLGWEIHDFSRLNSDGYISGKVKTLTLHSSAAYEINPQPVSGIGMYDKTGSVAGFRAYIVVVPKRQTGVVLLVNTAMPRTQVVLMIRKVLYQLARA